MTIERHTVNGSYVISDIVNGYRFVRNYYGYTRREAIAQFRADRREAIANR